ncbi:MAG: S-layer homology domain-containing protein [Clostridia bacterium]|nr:S-layer homology domain-containing protein [Clostridia bacterium]
MKRFYKRFMCMLLALVVVCATPVFAITNADVMRVFKKVHQDPNFLPQLYAAVPLYRELSITNESVNAKFKDTIRTVLNIAEAEKEIKNLRKDNFEQRMRFTTINTAASMEAAYIALCTDAFSAESVATLLNGDIPKEFEPLYNALVSETYIILGFSEDGKLTHVFDDLAGYAWAEEAITELFNRDIINGVSDFSFAPDAKVTREQFAKMLSLAFAIEPGPKQPVFSDVRETDWFYPYVTTMASRDLILGIGDDMFGSGQNITRQDMAVLMFRIGEMLGLFDRSNSRTSGFDDDRYIASYAKTAVITLKENGIIQGNELNCFNPTMPATRAEAAQMLYRCYQFANK